MSEHRSEAEERSSSEDSDDAGIGAAAAGGGPMDDVIERHRTACAGFDEVLATAASKDSWDAPSPCTEWDARGVVEHVIGFQDRLLVSQLGGQAQRPRDDPQARWLATEEAIFAALGAEGTLEKVVEVPGMGQSPVNRLLPTLTTDVLIHTWDLARAVGADVELDPELCRLAYERAVPFDDVLRSSGMFGAKVEVADDADLQTKLVAFFGRDPDWSA
jgi:uncharacterized protein (TIGR03086 family)